MIHPEFFLSDDVAALSVHARLTFIGLWCYFDDDGRGKDSPAAVCAAVWGMDEGVTPSRVADYLDEIETVGAVCRYEVNDQRYLHAPSWDRWQSITHPADPRIPPCPRHGGRPAKQDGRGRRPPTSRRTTENCGESPRTTENYRGSRRTTTQVVSVVSSDSAVEVPRPVVLDEDCEHGIDRHASCLACASQTAATG